MRLSKIHARVVVTEAYAGHAGLRPMVQLRGTAAPHNENIEVLVSSRNLDVNGVQIGSQYWVNITLQSGEDKVKEDPRLADYAVHLPRCGKDPMSAGRIDENSCTCGLNELLGLSPTES